MKLEDFISETLKQIISGVKNAQEFAKNSGAKVVPKNLLVNSNQGNTRIIEIDSNQIVQEIKFDIAVSITEGTQTSAGIGIFVGPIGVGSQGKSDESNTSTNRIKFEIPIILPTQSE